MTPDIAAQWIASATGMSLADVRDLGLTPDQVRAIGAGLAANPSLSFWRYEPQWKTGTFVCACGCGETFEARYRTKKPKYKNQAHRQRYYRRRKREQTLAAVEAARGQPVALVPSGNGKGLRVARADS